MKFSTLIIQIDFTTVIFHVFLSGIELTYTKHSVSSDRTNYHLFWFCRTHVSVAWNDNCFL